MRRAGPSPTLPIAIGAALLVALVSLAFLQFRWIAELSEAERDRLKASVDDGASRFCDDFDRELARAFRAFQLEDGLDEGRLEGEMAARLARWRSTSAEPKLVKELLVVTRRGPGEVELRRLDEAAGRLVPAPWSADVDSLQRIFRARRRVPRLDEVLPGLILPVRETRGPRDGAPEAPGQRRPLRDHVIVRLDLAWLKSVLLPRLAAGSFGGRDGLGYEVTVTLAAPERTVVFRAGPGVPSGASAGPSDADRGFFGLRSFPEPAGSPAAREPSRGSPRERAPAPPQAPAPPRGREGDAPEPAPETGLWRLEVRHPAGSLEAAVTGARRRNLALSLAALLLLTTTAALLVVSTRRAQRLALQQLDFVAAVSHELKTPLTAMRSAGQNLADGIVHDPEKVRRYGALVEREGRRLTEMVGRVLAFAGIRSGTQTFRMQPVKVGALVDAVLADLRWVLEEKRVQVEVEVADSLPVVSGDEAALRRALANLLDNALKYGGSARWIGVRARVATGPRCEEVVVAVSDRGIGVRRKDLPHLYEPFFRGSDAASAGISGSGLGLAVVRGVVEAHGGRVTAESVPGKGSTFSIHLPIAAGAAGTEETA